MMKKNLKNSWNRQRKSRETEKETKGSIKLGTSYTKKNRKENNQGNIEYARRVNGELQYSQSHKHHIAAQVQMHEGWVERRRNHHI